MFRHVLVAYDETERGHGALAVGADLARRTDARLTLAHVAPPSGEDEEHDDLLAELLGVGTAARRRKRLLTLAAVVAPDLETDVRVVAGAPAEVLPAIVRDAAPDVVVAGAGRPRLLRRGPSQALVKHAGVPVVLVTDPPSPDPMVDGAMPDAPLPPTHGRSLLWQLFAANALVLAAATAVLILTPVRVSDHPVLAEAIVLGAGLALMLGIHFVLLRRALSPLRGLSEVMGAVDLRAPGRRLPAPASGPAEVATLADAFNAMLERLEDERTESSRRALAAQEDERLRIARELHDQVGQALTALTLQAERAAQMEPVDRGLVERVAAAALQSLDDVRRIGRELRPEALDDLGLGNALISLCRRLSAQSGVRVVPALEPGLPELPAEAELVVYRIAQEAVTNALRHAEARQVDLHLGADGDGAVELVVRDDGRGMPERLPGDTAGLTGMRERALLVGGRLVIHDAAGGGTEVRLTVPPGSGGR